MSKYLYIKQIYDSKLLLSNVILREKKFHIIDEKYKSNQRVLLA